MIEKKYRKLSELKGWDKNPRTIDKKNFERLKKQITKLGEYKPLLITEDGTVLGGNMRLKAYQELGWDKAWVSVVEADTEKEKIEYALSDNDRAGQYDGEQMADLIGNFPEVEWNDYAVDIDPPKLVSEIMEKYSEVEEDEAPAVQEGEAESKLGEVYQLGRHRLMCGDSTDARSVAILMNGQKADMVFTDPPYLMGFEGNVHADGSKSFNAKHGAIKNDSMSREDGDKFIFNMFQMISDFNKGAYYVCFYRLGLDYIFRALDSHKTKYRALIIWDKGNHTLSNSDYMSRYEPIVYGWFKEHKFYGDRSNFDIWHITRTAKNELHPTMKPIELCVTAIKNSSVQDDIVLDLFGGSGSTLIACEQTNRICYMMELSPAYCDVIRKRYQNFIDKNESKDSKTNK